jgi:hypothetical protein
MRLCLPPVKQQARLLLCQPPNPIRKSEAPLPTPAMCAIFYLHMPCWCHGTGSVQQDIHVTNPLAACACVVAPNHGGQKEQTYWPHHGGLSFSFLY